MTLSRKHTRNRNRKQSSGLVSVYDGRQFIGDALQRGSDLWLAIAADGRRVGRFRTSKEAVQALMESVPTPALQAVGGGP